MSRVIKGLKCTMSFRHPVHDGVCLCSYGDYHSVAIATNGWGQGIGGDSMVTLKGVSKQQA